MGGDSEKAVPWSWTSSLWNFEKMHLLLKPPSLWHFVVAALTEQHMHILHTEKWRCRDTKQLAPGYTSRKWQGPEGSHWGSVIMSSVQFTRMLCWFSRRWSSYVWAWVEWLHSASAFPLPSMPLPVPLLSRAQCLWTVHFGLYWIGTIAPTESLPLIRVNYMLWLRQYYGSEWAGSANTVAFFFSSALTFQIVAMLAFFYSKNSLIVLLNAAFVVDSWLSSSGKEFLGKDGKKRKTSCMNESDHVNGQDLSSWWIEYFLSI